MTRPTRQFSRPSYYSESFSTKDIAFGVGGDCGIDCVATAVNG